MNKSKMVKEFEKELTGIRDGVDGVLGWIADTDHTIAPASSGHHGSYPHGLLEHELAVLGHLRRYNEKMLDNLIPDDSIVIMALLHDLCKCNFYTLSFRNKQDEDGNWNKVPWYNVDDAFPAGHGEKSIFIIQKYIQLNWEEVLAIRWHQGAYDAQGYAQGKSLGAAMKLTPWILALHTADMIDATDPSRFDK